MSLHRVQSPVRFDLDPLESRRVMSAQLPADIEVNLLLNANGTPVVSQTTQTHAPTGYDLSRFQWFDGTTPRTRYALTNIGLQDMIATSQQIFLDINDYYADEGETRAVARDAQATGRMICLDVERWKVDNRFHSEEVVAESVAIFSQVIGWIRDETPDVLVGVYSMFPVREYDTALYQLTVETQWTNSWSQGYLPTATKKYAVMQAANDRLAELAARVDVIFPSIYAFYEDQAGWRRYAEHAISEARRYGKPVVPFVWARYHNSAPNGLAWQLLPDAYWELQLQTVRELADGVAIWAHQDDEWTANSTWVQTLADYVQADWNPQVPEPPGSGSSRGGNSGNTEGSPNGSTVETDYFALPGSIANDQTVAADTNAPPGSSISFGSISLIGSLDADLDRSNTEVYIDLVDEEGKAS
jgi:hypothetical protein